MSKETTINYSRCDFFLKSVLGEGKPGSCGPFEEKSVYIVRCNSKFQRASLRELVSLIVSYLYRSVTSYIEHCGAGIDHTMLYRY